MTVILNLGPIWLNNGTDYLKLVSRDPPQFIPKFKPTFIDYPGGSSSIDIGEFHYQIQIGKIFFSAKADYETFMSTIKTWQAAGPFYFEYCYDGSNKLAFDGSATSYKVRLTDNGIQNAKPVNLNGTPIMEVALLTLRQG